MRKCGTVWNCVESVEWGVEKFHTGALLRTNSVISPYYLRVKSVPAPYLHNWNRYGAGTDLARLGYDPERAFSSLFRKVSAYCIMFYGLCPVVVPPGFYCFPFAAVLR